MQQALRSGVDDFAGRGAVLHLLVSGIITNARGADFVGPESAPNVPADSRRNEH